MIAFMFGCIVVFVFISIIGWILKSGPAIFRILFGICVLCLLGVFAYALLDIYLIHPEQYADNKPVAAFTTTDVAPTVPVLAPPHRKQQSPYQQCASRVSKMLLPPGRTIQQQVHDTCYYEYIRKCNPAPWIRDMADPYFPPCPEVPQAFKEFVPVLPDGRRWNPATAQYK